MWPQPQPPSPPAPAYTFVFARRGAPWDVHEVTLQGVLQARTRGSSPYSPAIVPRLSFDVSRSKRRTATCHHRVTLALRLLLRDGRITLALRLLLRDGRVMLALRLLLRDGRIEEGTCLLLREIPEFYFLWEVRASCFEDSGNSPLVKRP